MRNTGSQERTEGRRPWERAVFSGLQQQLLLLLAQLCCSPLLGPHVVAMRAGRRYRISHELHGHFSQTLPTLHSFFLATWLTRGLFLLPLHAILLASAYPFKLNLWDHDGHRSRPRRKMGIFLPGSPPSHAYVSVRSIYTSFSFYCLCIMFRSAVIAFCISSGLTDHACVKYLVFVEVVLGSFGSIEKQVKNAIQRFCHLEHPKLFRPSLPYWAFPAKLSCLTRCAQRRCHASCR